VSIGPPGRCDERSAYRLFGAALRIRCLTNSSGRSRLATITDRGVSMHDTAMEIGKRFFDTYAKNRSNLIIVDVGSQDVNGSLRSVAPPNNEYIGLDFVEGEGVDVVITDPYSLPLEDNSIDIVVCSSCFEHSEFFWLLFNDIQRLLKPSGLFYLNVPSNGLFHRYPVDCWRFYPDSGVALQNWARRNGLKTTLLESFTGTQKMDRWNDFVAVFVKDPSFINNYADRIQTTFSDYTNGLTFETKTFTNAIATQEDQRPSLKKHIRSLAYWVYGHLPGFIKQRMRAVHKQ